MLALCMSAGAQTMYDGFTMGEINYYGTARSMALGNAMTAIGCDLGSVGINPAGSAVTNYSQFTVTPGLSVATTANTYTLDSYSNTNAGRKSRFGMPNIGVVINFDTYRYSGLKSYTIGFVSNTTNLYTEGVSASGVNAGSSLFGSFAANAGGYSPSDLGSFDNFYNSNIPWAYLAAYQSYGISDFQKKDGSFDYVGATEQVIENPDGTYSYRTAGKLNQSVSHITKGRKNDMLFNFGANFNDNFYLGANIGLPIMNYSYSEMIRESAQNPSEFAYAVDGSMVEFEHGEYQYGYTADVDGIYAKVGFIWLPIAGLRIGAAIQTPTLYDVQETWQLSSATFYTNRHDDHISESPDNDFAYSFTSPYRVNAGLAYTFGRFGFLTVDYEMADYSHMKYSATDQGLYDSIFNDTNETNRNFAGMQHMLRAGAEVVLTPSWSVRAGYTYKNSPEFYYKDQNGNFVDANIYLACIDDFRAGRNSLNGKTRFDAALSSYSLGLGYTSSGSFFMDFAVRMSRYPKTEFNLYGEYDGNAAPYVTTSKNLFDALMTFGWKF